VYGSNNVLALSAANTYTGPTTVTNATLLVNGQIGSGAVTVGTNGTLGGDGIITGPVTVFNYGTLEAGNQAIGTLAISNTLTFKGGSTNVVLVNAALGTNDLVKGVTTVTFNGTLAAANLSGTLAAGDNFKVFSASTYAGSFTNIVGSPGSGLGWSFNSANGVLSVVQTSIIPNVPPDITSFILAGNLAGTNVIMRATNGVNGGTYYLLATTNLALPLSKWIAVATNVVTVSGSTEGFNFIGTNVISGAAHEFFLLSNTNN
jgi:autotransporter-associated beta strand protein